MTVKIDPLDYLGKKFASCWHFAAKFYNVPEDTPLDAFDPVDEPEDGDYFLVYRAGRVYHCGICVRGGFLHQQFAGQGVVFTKQGFPDVRYYRPHASLRHGAAQ